jgi:glucose-6-phosphate 1-dehydrogenase
MEAVSFNRISQFALTRKAVANDVIESPDGLPQDSLDLGRLNPAKSPVPSEIPVTVKPSPALLDILTSSSKPIPSGRFYIFGATGDLVSKRAVRDSLVQMAEAGRLNPEQHPLILMGSKPYPAAGYLEKFKKGDADSKPITEKGFQAFKELAHLTDEQATLMGVNLSNLSDFDQLKKDAGDVDAVFFGAVAPKFYKPLLENLKESGLSESNNPEGFRRVLLEKPFGADSSQAKELAEIAARDFKPGQVLLIDHFLGYPGMLQMIHAKSSPELDEALQAKYVENVDIKLLETIKSNDRPYFRETGLLKDMVQNHAMQILSSFAMDLPTAISGQQLRQAREKVIESVEIDKASVQRGQFVGFNDPAQGAPVDAAPSQAETLVAFDLKVHTPRWEGVQFHIVNAKAVDHKRSGVDVHLRSLPQALADKLGVAADQPAVIAMTVNGKPKMEVQFPQSGTKVDLPTESSISDQPAYSNLIANAFQGESALFATPKEALGGWKVADEVEAAWQGKPIISYAPGSSLDQISSSGT